MESEIYPDETSGLSPEVIILEHQSSEKYLLSMLLDSPLQSREFLLPKRHTNEIDETAVLNNKNSHLPHIPRKHSNEIDETAVLNKGNSHLPHIATEVPSSSQSMIEIDETAVLNKGNSHLPHIATEVPSSSQSMIEIDETAVLNKGNSHLLHIATEVPSSSQSSASELMQLLSQAAVRDSLAKESSKASDDDFDPITFGLVVPNIQSQKEGKSVGEFFPKKNLVMGPRCNCKLSKTSKKFHCNDISEDDRSAMFTMFWKKMDFNQRKKLISCLVKCSLPQRRRKWTKGVLRKEFAFQYHLMKSAKLLRVCKVMFLSTFNIGEFAVREWVVHKISDGDT